MLVSIVIPAYNGERFLATTIRSVQNQTLADWELVIVDDGSADGTARVAATAAANDPRIRLVRQANAGVAAARNRGLREAHPSSAYIIFLDQDDVWEADALETLIAELCRHPSAVAANGLSRAIDDEEVECDPGALEEIGRDRRGIVGTRWVSWPRAAPNTLAVLAVQNCIYTPGQVLIRRQALAEVGLFDTTLAPADDWDMWLRLCLIGEIVFVDRVLLNWRLHENNGSAQLDRIYRLHVRVREKLLATPELSREQRRIILAANWHWSRFVRALRQRWVRELVASREWRSAITEIGGICVDVARSLVGVPVSARPFRPSLRMLYRSACTTPGDIYEHLDTLRRLTCECRHVTEFGTRSGVSTTALLCGYPEKLVTYDRERWPTVEILLGAAGRVGRTEAVFHQADVREVEIEETDLLFIDTWHVYEQLKHELALHADKVQKYLVFHDTTTYGEQGETPGHRGLWPAIEEFLQANPTWTLVEWYTHCNGLTILKRIGEPARQAGERSHTGSYTRPASREVAIH